MPAPLDPSASIPACQGALEPARFAAELNGRRVGLFVLRSARLQAAFCNHGARLLQLFVPDRDGRWRDVVLGHDSLPQLLEGMPSVGAFIGRFANRIAQARLVLDGKTEHLPPNEGPHCLHGGPGGSRHQVFEVRSQHEDRLQLAWTFRRVDDGFPGEVALELDIALLDATVRWDWRAQVREAATPLSFTTHPFFNLDGVGPGEAAVSVLDHRLQIDATHFLPLDGERIPLGHAEPVSDGAFDFRSERSLRDALGQPHAQLDLGAEPGFDHTFVTAGWPLAAAPASAALVRQARLRSPGSGIAMEVWSQSPALQLYSGQALDGRLPRHAGKHDRIYRRYAGLCLEPQCLPDAPNRKGEFGHCVHRPGETLTGRIEYRFGLA